MSEKDFMTLEKELVSIGTYLKREAVQIRISDATEILKRGLKHFLGDDARWLMSYNEIADWLSDNKGRGLLCMGGVGLGKSLICARILPLVLYHYANRIIRVYDATDINENIDEIKGQKLFIIDDAGVEGIGVKYGNRRNALAEIVDWCERSGALMVITTNLTTDQLVEKYGERTMDRLRATTRKVVFTGKSFRK